MARFVSPLDRVRIAAPCSANWDQMMGTDRVRFCAQCNLNVYNLSSMTRNDAESFIARNEGRLCVRFYRRTDGSILTQNCPVGLAAIRRRLSSVGKVAASAIFSFLAGLGLHEALSGKKFQNPPQMGVFVETIGDPSTTVAPPVVMGNTGVPPSTQAPPVWMGRAVIKKERKLDLAPKRPKYHRMNAE